MVSIRDINEDNFDEIINMKRPDGEKYVASNAYSLAQAWLYRENNDVFPYAIYNDEEPVGFLLLEEDYEERAYRIWRIMFPEENANKGYGSKAIELVIEMAKQRADEFDVLALDCEPSNTRGRHVYEKLGFQATGGINHGSDEMFYNLK